MTRYILYLCMITGLTLSGCTEEGSSGSSSPEFMIPVEENIPFYDRDHTAIEGTRSLDELENSPDELELLHNFLEDPESHDLKRLDASVGDPENSGMYVHALDKHRLAILDVDGNQLLEYDLNSNRTAVLAEFGRGPSDIQFAKELIRRDKYLYVVREDMYIARFDCSDTPCEYDEAISTEFNPISFVPFGDSYSVLGVPELNGSGSDLQPLRLVDADGEVTSTFGHIYNPEGNFMILQPFFTEGKLQYSPSNHAFILSYQRLPFIYMYDAESLELKDTYELTRFVMGKLRYHSERRTLENPTNDHHEIINMKVMNDRFLLIETKAYKNFRREIPAWDYEYDFYALDLESKESFYLGGYSQNDETDKVGDRRIFITKGGILVYDYRGGMLYWLNG